MRFEDKVVIVTGSSRGLGRVIAIAFAREGCNVVVNYNTSKVEAEQTVKTIKSLDQGAIAIRADVSNEDHVEKMVEATLHQFHKIDILINNAGIHNDATVWKMDKGMWDEVLQTNLTGVFNCTKHVLDHMRKQNYGKIINVSSVVGQAGAFGTANYSASKAGIIGFTKTVAKEVARRGITANVISLGYIDIGMGRNLSEEMKSMLLQQIPLGRFGKPEEVTQTVLFLASDDASYITGQVININGGFY